MSKRSHFTDIGLTGVVYNNVSVTTTGITGGGAIAPDYVQIADDGAGSTGVGAYAFDSAVEEELLFILQAPFSYKEGTDVSPHIHWMPMTSGSGTVVWGLEVLVVNEGSAVGNTSFFSAASSTNSIAKQLFIDNFDDIDGSAFKFNSTMLARVFRDATNASDTYTGDAALLLMDFNHLMDTIGSDGTHSKTPGNKG